MNDKDKYRNLCKDETTIPIFSKDWWLDAVAGEGNWDVILVEKGDEIVASLPYVKRKKMFLEYITMPQLTQTAGIWIKYPKDQKYTRKLSYEKEIFNEVINNIPKVDYFSQNFHYSITNWLPFYWRGYSQTTKYTYVIEGLSNLDEVFKNFSQAKKKDIKKAEKIVRVFFDLSAEEFYKNHTLTLSKQNLRISYSYDLFKRIYDTVYANDAGKTIYAIDEEGNLHSALLVIWDENSAYDLISTIDPDYRNSGSASLLVKNIISYIANKTEKFDFEGSMIENVEQSFRNFGAVQKPYFNISKTNSKLLKIRNSIKEVMK
ncbi:methicillin resistance protein [Pseudobacillus wudalianchiensis]|uniref:Methicillin resistance protein n=1 Tax=Pseudobacillus wudalianchiensis TaxID=1743143 RepID=A0A1B9AYN8_9BACI|nr:methicillin resistance protein [Bacillus wudalianchiensis]OCA88920.1 methicillin resistance protein [Bacillus wudalianchiensis]